MKTQLLLTVFEKVGDQIVNEFDISHYDLAKINKICPPDLPNDFEYCDGHFVKEDQYLKLKQFIVEFSNYNYESYDFNIGTFRVK